MADLMPRDGIFPSDGAILVTGSSGFVGRRLVRRLRANGYRVYETARFDIEGDGDRRGWLALIAALIAALGAVMTLPLAAARLPEIFLVNESRSLPRGLYVRRFNAAPDRGRLVAFVQPEAARSYLAGLGAPPDMMLLKRVAAVGGDHVCRRRDGLHAPGVRAPASAAWAPLRRPRPWASRPT